jgi:glycerophosphoryl diester phosphodiesterase
VYILGHRGYPKKYTENTLESFKAAIEFGADGIELDVWRTKDGEIIVTHDENLQRVFGIDLNVKESSLEEIKNKAPLPTLKEVFEIIPRGKIINIEIKDVDAGEDVIKLVKEYNLSKFVIFSSFDHELIKKLSQKYLDERFGFLFDESHIYLTLEDIKKMFEPANIFSANLPVQLIELDNELFNKLTQLLRYMGKKIVLWTVNAEKILTNIHVDYIITDDVEKMVKILKKK